MPAEKICPLQAPEYENILNPEWQVESTESASISPWEDRLPFLDWYNLLTSFGALEIFDSIHILHVGGSSPRLEEYCLQADMFGGAAC